MLVMVRKKPSNEQKRAVVVRYGAWGDSVLVTPVLRQLKKEGYHVTFNCTERCYEVLKRNPNIDTFVLQATDEVQKEKLGEHYQALSKQFDRMVNLNGSIEGALLKVPGQPEYRWNKDKRHQVCNKNYMDWTMELAGYPEAKGEQPEIHFRNSEEKWAKTLLNKHPGSFNVLISMTGSSLHKIYPHMDSVVGAIEAAIPEGRVYLVGEGGCKGIINETEKVRDFCGEFGIRKSFVLTKYVDCVISTETSVAMAASCYDTPKVIMLSHASEENLTKYWRNCHTIVPPVSCHPCHKLHYVEVPSCPTEDKTKLPICAALLHPGKVCDAVEEIYKKWRLTRGNSGSTKSHQHSN